MAIPTDPYILGAAHVQLDQWEGTAAAENDITIYSDNLYAVLGLDREAWSILAIEFQHGTETGGHGSVDVYAIDRVANGLEGLSHEKLIALGEQRGNLPVTHFAVHQTNANQIIDRVFKRYKVQLISRNVQQFPLQVEQLGDLQLDE